MVEGYRKDIDGLRAIAVLAVIAYHYDFGLYGGYVGVDIFFVISGYLITGTILSDISNSTFSLANFTERRVRRILPASICVSFVTLPTAYFIFLPADFIDLAKSVMAQIAFVSNYFFWNSSGYFAEESETKPLLHTWSLSLEEQFYICFALLLLLKNLRNPQKLFWIFLIVFCISFFISEYCSFKHPSVNYFFLPTRAYEILLGGILAIAFDSLKNFPIIFKEIISWCGLSLIVFPMLLFDESTRFPGLSALLPCFGAALIILSGAGQNTNVSKVLSVKPFVFFGLISYSLYLWHWPIISFAKYLTIEPLSLEIRVILLLLCLIVSVFSWLYIETPFRKKNWISSQKAIFSIAIGACCILFLGSGVIVFLHGMPFRMGSEVLALSNSYKIDRERVQKDSYTVGIDEIKKGEIIRLSSKNGSSEAEHLDMLIWGDSHAAAILPALSAICNEHNISVAAIIYAATFPIVDFENKFEISMGKNSMDYSAAAIEIIRREKPKTVVLVSEWHSFNKIKASLIKTVKLIKETGSEVWLMKSVPVPRFDAPRALAIAKHNGVNTDTIGIDATKFTEQREMQHQFFHDVLAETGPVNLLDPMPYFSIKNGKIQLLLNGKSLYCDGSHLSHDGAILIKPMLEKVLN